MPQAPQVEKSGTASAVEKLPWKARFVHRRISAIRPTAIRVTALLMRTASRGIRLRCQMERRALMGCRSRTGGGSIPGPVA